MASSKREKELARQRAERQAARRAAAERKRKQRNAIIASVAAVMLIVGIGAFAAVSLTGDDGDDRRHDDLALPLALGGRLLPGRLTLCPLPGELLLALAARHAVSS